ncbi:MAG: ROK family protein [Chlorobi bacterium]|nr:ROK family protein [Chlorobiota bacterium]MCI0717038.1 ROK family protein [Chlorobiota bacterium]
MITLQTSPKKVNYALGIDLGGTYIKSAIIDSKGKIIKQYKTESYSIISPQKVIRQIEKCIIELKKGFDRKILGIGIGAPGIVTKGVVKYPPNFKSWKEVNFKKHFEKKFKLETEVDNDANCAGLAELKFGFGRKYKNFIFLTLGTGIGGAIVTDGNLYRGEQNGAGEFGMMTINFNGPYCLGGNYGAVEAYLGRNYFLENEKSQVKLLGIKIDIDDIQKLAGKNNKIARELFKKYGFYLGVGLANYFNLMDVRTAILGGGISNAYKYFITECIKTIKERSIKTIRNKFKVLKSNINNNAGVLGAAALVLY